MLFKSVHITFKTLVKCSYSESQLNSAPEGLNETINVQNWVPTALAFHCGKQSIRLNYQS